MEVKHQYSIVQGLYWISGCALGGYAAVYLQYKGLSNTLIGVVMGVAALLSMAAQPLVAQLAENVRGFSVKRVLQLLIVLMFLFYGILTVVPLSVGGVMVVFIMMNICNSCMPALLSAMGMEFINRGYYLNFGLSRGIGSISYAVCAVILGFVIERFLPGILGYIYMVLAVLLFVAISCMKDLSSEEKTVVQSEEKKSEKSIWKVFWENKVLLYMGIGFWLGNMANASICTYMVNIIKGLGGTDSTLGIGAFASAASEMPVMMLFGYMMKRSNCVSLLKVSSFFFLVKSVTMLFAFNVPMVFFGLAMQGLSFGLFYPASVYYVNNELPEEYRVKGQAAFSILTSGAATCVGNLLGGWLQDAFGLKAMLLSSSVMALLGFLIVFSVRQEKQRQEMPLWYWVHRWLYHKAVNKKK